MNTIQEGRRRLIMKLKFAQLGLVGLLVTLLVLTSVFSVGRAARNAAASPAAIALKPCTQNTLKGRYAVSGSGTKALGGIGPISVVGLGEFDGAGSILANDTVSLNGAIFHRTYSGSYQVNDNCTGSATFVFPPPRNVEAHLDFVIVDDGDRAYFIETDADTDLRVEAKRQ